MTRLAVRIRPRALATDWAALLDAVAAGIRSGHSLRTSVERAATRWPGGVAPHFDALHGAFEGDDYRIVVRAIDGARSMTGNPAAVLQAAAAVIRERRAAAAHAATHSTQATASATLLTLLPVAVCVVGMIASRSFRHAVSTAQGAAVTLAGLVLNMIGWVVIRRLIRAAARLGGPAAAFNDAAQLVVIALRAGELPAAAIEWVSLGGDPLIRPAFAAVVAAHRRGRRFADALHELVVMCGPVAVPFTEAIAAAELDGLPLAPVIERISADVRAERTRLHDIAVRRLPVRLTLPLVACTLPAFALLTITPMVIAAVQGLHY